jgi:hypothetical protein
LRSLENGVSASLKCHFVGLAVQVPELEAVNVGKRASETNPKAADFDVEAVKKASYKSMSELAYNKYGVGLTDQPDVQQPTAMGRGAEALVKARAKIVESLKGAPEVIELGDLFPDGRFRALFVPGAFAPIFFEYILPKSLQPKRESPEDASLKKLYFVYNGRFLTVAALCGPGRGVPALQEAVSEVCLHMAKSGLEFRWLSPIPTFQSLDQGNVSAAPSLNPALLNDSGRAGAMTSALMRMPRNAQGALRSLYATAFQSLMSFYSLKDESDTEDALIQTIDSHRKTLLDLMHEFNQTKGSQFLRRRKLRKLIRVHCFNLTEKIGRVDALSDSLAQGMVSLEGDLQNEPELRVMFERDPNWKSYLHHDFDTKPVLDMVARTSDEINRNNMGKVILWVALLAAAVGGLVGFFISRVV